jgi:hypothetical protein
LIKQVVQCQAEDVLLGIAMPDLGEGLSAHLKDKENEEHNLSDLPNTTLLPS